VALAATHKAVLSYVVGMRDTADTGALALDLRADSEPPANHVRQLHAIPERAPNGFEVDRTASRCGRVDPRCPCII